MLFPSVRHFVWMLVVHSLRANTVTVDHSQPKVGTVQTLDRNGEKHILESDYLALEAKAGK